MNTSTSNTDMFVAWGYVLWAVGATVRAVFRNPKYQGTREAV